MNAPDRHEVLQREFEAFRKYMEAKTSKLEAEVVELRAGHWSEPWKDYKQVAAHFSMGRDGKGGTGRTVQTWRKEGAPFQIRDGKQKTLLSHLLPWVAENHPEYLPPGYGSGDVVPLRPEVGGSDAEAA